MVQTYDESLRGGVTQSVDGEFVLTAEYEELFEMVKTFVNCKDCYRLEQNYKDLVDYIRGDK